MGKEKLPEKELLEGDREEEKKKRKREQNFSESKYFIKGILRGNTDLSSTIRGMRESMGRLRVVLLSFGEGRSFTLRSTRASNLVREYSLIAFRAESIESIIVDNRACSRTGILIEDELVEIPLISALHNNFLLMKARVLEATRAETP